MRKLVSITYMVFKGPLEEYVCKDFSHNHPEKVTEDPNHCM